MLKGEPSTQPDETLQLGTGQNLFVEIAPKMHIEGSVQIVVGVALRTIVPISALKNPPVGRNQVVVRQVGPAFFSSPPGLQAAQFLDGVVSLFPGNSGVVNCQIGRKVEQMVAQFYRLCSPILTADYDWGGYRLSARFLKEKGQRYQDKPKNTKKSTRSSCLHLQKADGRNQE